MDSLKLVLLVGLIQHTLNQVPSHTHSHTHIHNHISLNQINLMEDLLQDSQLLSNQQHNPLVNKYLIHSN
jgi:hypothetical protein